MSDRTWNQIDAKLYEEDWSRGARIVAGILLARCPDQYGVFDFPLGYIKDFFQGIFTPMELTGFFQEWEAAKFVRFYRDGKVIWIRAKWKRAGKPSDNHWKGLYTHLEGFPEVREDFLSYYQPPPNPLPTPSEPPVNPESESESDTEKKKEIQMSSLRSDGTSEDASLPKKNGKPSKPKGNTIPIEDRKATTENQRLVQQWYRQHLKYDEVRWSGDPAKMGGQARILLRDHEYPDLIAAMNYLFDLKPHEDYRPHTWDFYVRKISTLLVESQQHGYFPDPKLKLECVKNG